jgi:uncharacterized protein (DUF1800 family)
MNKSNLWSLRLGFSSKEALEIEKNGIEKFIQESLRSSVSIDIPDFLKEEPKTIAELVAWRQTIKNASSEEKKQIIKHQLKRANQLKIWWLDKIRTEEYPLREKMVGFWHNHFVCTLQKVKSSYWIYQQNCLLRENAFGNFKQLTKIMIQTNAMVRYLDNVDNKKEKINENLSRELLELFTLGIGNYTEDDIKNGAKALAGLGLGDTNAQYRRYTEDNSDKTYFGKTGNFKADDLVDIIFEQKNIPYLITRKLLKWFIYDNPSEELVTYYGDYFRKMNFEMEPLLIKIFTEEFAKQNAGSKIKDPLIYVLQLIDEIQLHATPSQSIVFFCKQQGMDLFDQPNVKGWDGGNSWLSSQIYLQRNNTSDLLCSGKTINRKMVDSMSEIKKQNGETFEKVKPKIDFDTNGNTKNIISQLSERLLFRVDDAIQKDMEDILKYDFDTKSENANQAVLRLFNYISKTPEYQLI